MPIPQRWGPDHPHLGPPHLRRVNRACRGCGTRGCHSPDTTLQTKKKTLLVKAESSLEEAAKQTLNDLPEPRAGDCAQCRGRGGLCRGWAWPLRGAQATPSQRGVCHGDTTQGETGWRGTRRGFGGRAPRWEPAEQLKGNTDTLLRREGQRLEVQRGASEGEERGDRARPGSGNGGVV